MLTLNPARNWDFNWLSLQFKGMVREGFCNSYAAIRFGCAEMDIFAPGASDEVSCARNDWGPPWLQRWKTDWNSEALTWASPATCMVPQPRVCWPQPLLGGCWWILLVLKITSTNFMLPLAPCFWNAVLAIEGEPGSEMFWICRSKCTACEIAGALIGLCLTCWDTVLKQQWLAGKSGNHQA